MNDILYICNNSRKCIKKRCPHHIYHTSEMPESFECFVSCDWVAESKCVEVKCLQNK